MRRVARDVRMPGLRNPSRNVRERHRDRSLVPIDNHEVKMRIEALADHTAVRERLTLSNRLAQFDERSVLSDMGVHCRGTVRVLDLHVVG